MSISKGYEFADNDVISPEVYEKAGHPRDAFAWLRENDPLRLVSPDGYKPFWVVTKHEDIVEIEKQPDIFTSEPRPILMAQASAPEVQAEIIGEIFKRLQDSPKLLQVMASAGEGGLIRSLVQMDPPDHTRYRALVQPWFKPTNIKVLEGRLNKIIKEVLDAMMGDGTQQTVDFAQDIAVNPPLRLITELLGVPEKDEWRILKLTTELFAGDDPEMRRMADDPLSIFDTIKDIYEYFDKLTDELRANPTESLASYIANGKLDGEHLPFKELISYYTIVATAGHDTTKNAIVGGLHALVTHPEQLARFKEIVHDEDALKLAVEEILRWTTPVAQFARTAEKDYVLRGQTIKKGDTVGLMYASGSFDEDIFENPSEFNIERKPNRHLAFGTGPHQCLGLLLARLELRIFFQQLVPRLAEVELTEAPDRIKASFVHGIKHLNIRYRLTA
jgi:cytochrome P450